MKRCVMICILAFFVVWCLNTDVMASKHRHLQGNAKVKSNSDADFSIETYLDKYIESNGEDKYSIDFEIHEDDESGSGGISKIQIEPPKGQKMDLKNGMRLACFELESGLLSLKDFQDIYPEGKYKTTLYPKSKYGSRTFDISHNFPPVPEITYPENGAVDLPLSFTIEWESNDYDDVYLALKIGNDEDSLQLEPGISQDTTSFVIPDGLLKTNTQFEIELTAEWYIDGVEYNTTRSIVFTTGSE